MQKFTRYYEAISYLEGLSNLPTESNYMIDRRNLPDYLKRMRYFLRLLGNPHRNIKYIHVTGTAGKGSVTNMLHEVLLASGKNVGSFTSPFVTTTIEKIKVGDLYISPDEFTDILEKIKPAIDLAYLKGPWGRPSYFEILLAIGFIYFKQKKCEWVVLEVGCGGRYDATNVIEKPLVTAITNIDFDHMELIGPTLQKIAYEKVGIIKKGSMFFTSEQRPRFLMFFKSVCAETGADFHSIPHQDSYDIYNKTLVTEISRALKIPDTQITKGIENHHIQCRFEIMQKNPMIVLDGAHNRIKVRSTIENLKKLAYRKLFLIVGISNNKEHLSILSQLVPLADHAFFTRFQVKERKCAHPKELLEKSEGFFKKGSKYTIYLDNKEALAHAKKLAGKDDLILVVGSFFLAGELRKIWYSEEHILAKRKYN